jgi:bifunctional DNase/RNase
MNFRHFLIIGRSLLEPGEGEQVVRARSVSCLALENPTLQRMLSPMQTLVRVEPIALLPTQAGCAVFLGDGNKTIVFYIDPGVGASINASLSGQLPPRPLTHDLYLQTLQTFGAKVSRAVIVRMEQEIYYARLIVEAENEIMERKIVELDARPSDCLGLVVRCGAPFYVVKELWDTLDDMTGVLREMRESGGADEGDTPDLGIL